MKQKPQKPCEVCAAPFVPQGPAARYCSARCRLLAHAKPVVSGCIEWQGTKSGGYGVTRGLNGRSTGAHRLAWEIANGPIPKGLVICHDCDNRSCINPDHMRLGTPADNSRDMVERERSARGERVNTNRLSMAQIGAIREELAGPSPRSHREIAASFGVCRATISHINNRRNWAWLK